MTMPTLPEPTIPTEDIAILSFYTPDQMYEYGSKCMKTVINDCLKVCMDINPIYGAKVMDMFRLIGAWK